MAIVIMGMLLLTVVLGPMREQTKRWFTQKEEEMTQMPWEELPRLEEKSGQTAIRLGSEPMRAGQVLSLKNLFSAIPAQEGGEREYYITDVTDDRNEKVLQILSGLTKESDPATIAWKKGRCVGFDEENQTLIIRKAGIYRITVRLQGEVSGKRTFELMVTETRGGERI